jgi:hypothetical protein
MKVKLNKAQFLYKITAAMELDVVPLIELLAASYSVFEAI